MLKIRLFTFIAVITNLYASQISDILIITSDKIQTTNDHITETIHIKTSRKLTDRIQCRNVSLENECSNGVLNQQIKYFHSPIRIIGRRISEKSSPLDIRTLVENIKNTYLIENTDRKLSFIILITNNHLISILKIFLELENDSRIPLVVVNTDKYANLIDTQEEKIVNRKLVKFCHLTPTVNILFESISYLKRANNLENIMFYGTDPKEIFVLKEYESIGRTYDINELLESFINRHPDNIETFLESANDLLVVKCDKSRLKRLMCFYSELRTMYYSEDLHTMNNEPLRYMVWIPEHNSEQGNYCLNTFNLILNFNTMKFVLVSRTIGKKSLFF